MKRNKLYLKIFLFLLITISLLLAYQIPMIETTSFWVFKNKVGILQTIKSLSKTDTSLAWIIFIFSVVMPITKLFIVGYLLFSKEIKPKAMTILSLISKWSMGDVFVVGILIVVLKTSAYLNAKIMAGTYFFTISVILMAIIDSYYSYKFKKIN